MTHAMLGSRLVRRIATEGHNDFHVGYERGSWLRRGRFVILMGSTTLRYTRKEAEALERYLRESNRLRLLAGEEQE